MLSVYTYEKECGNYSKAVVCTAITAFNRGWLGQMLHLEAIINTQ